MESDPKTPINLLYTVLYFNKDLQNHFKEEEALKFLNKKAEDIKIRDNKPHEDKAQLRK